MTEQKGMLNILSPCFLKKARELCPDKVDRLHRNIKPIFNENDTLEIYKDEDRNNLKIYFEYIGLIQEHLSEHAIELSASNGYRPLFFSLLNVDLEWGLLRFYFWDAVHGVDNDDIIIFTLRKKIERGFKITIKRMIKRGGDEALKCIEESLCSAKQSGHFSFSYTTKLESKKIIISSDTKTIDIVELALLYFHIFEAIKSIPRMGEIEFRVSDELFAGCDVIRADTGD